MQKFRYAACITILFLGFNSFEARAQNCTSVDVTTAPPGFLPTTFNSVPYFGSGLAASQAIVGSVTVANLAFLTQSTAFVSAPPNPPANAEGGGVWVRGVGGELSINTASSVTASLATIGQPTSTGTGSCSSKFHESFAGVQLGQDISRLNINGWNVHLGTTAGYLETKGNIVGGNVVGGAFDASTQAPFAGVYLTATKGNLSFEGLARYNVFNTNLNSPTAFIFNQSLGAHGFAFAGAVSYHWNIPNTQWFFEPSAGLIYSNVSVDPFNSLSPVAGGGQFSGTTKISNLESTIGRLGARVGTNLQLGQVLLQPFAAASVWSEFGPSISATYASCSGCIVQGGSGIPQSLTASLSSQNIGTFGQYSLGVSGRITNTGWLGFARVDYRNGNHIDGWSGTGGIRYQYDPGPNQPTAKLPVKAARYDGLAAPYRWTGVYVGGSAGASFGQSRLDFPAIGVAVDPRVAGPLGGLQLGYNYQSAQWVFGVEGAVDWTRTSGARECRPLVAPSVVGPPAIPLFQMNCGGAVDWIASVTGRVAYAFGRTLFYGKAGIAWDHQVFSATCNLGPQNGGIAQQQCNNPAGNITNLISVSNNPIGWTAGYGVEFAITPSWSAKAEYNYFDFGTKNLTASDGTLINAGLHVSTVKVGVNYRFGEPSAISVRY